MQPRSIGPKTQRLVEPEATIPECVYDMIEGVAQGTVLAFAKHADSVALRFCANNGATATRFDARAGREAFPYGPGERGGIYCDFGSRDGGEGNCRIELRLLIRGRPGSQWGA